MTTEGSSGIALRLEDARRFILVNRHVGGIAPLQLYSSTIAWAPEQHCSKCPWSYHALDLGGPSAPLSWSLELQKLEGRNTSVNVVALSRHGSMLSWDPAMQSRLDGMMVWSAF